MRSVLPSSLPAISVPLRRGWEFCSTTRCERQTGAVWSRTGRGSRAAMEYVIPVVLVVLLIGGFVTFFVLNATKKSGPAATSDEGAPGIGADETPLGDTTEHAGEQNASGATTSGSGVRRRGPRPRSRRGGARQPARRGRGRRAARVRGRTAAARVEGAAAARLREARRPRAVSACPRPRAAAMFGLALSARCARVFRPPAARGTTTAPRLLDSGCPPHHPDGAAPSSSWPRRPRAPRLVSGPRARVGQPR